ncbi:MAG: LysM peptidoglycan-binding domain-containing protein [Acidimicrobiia bacterium]
MSRAAYVRRRLSVAVLAVGLVLVTAQAGVALGGSSPAPGRAPTAPAAQDQGVSTVVQPGDSLWSLARRLAPEQDPRPVVDALRAARHGRPLLVGETVRWDE